MAGLKVQIAKGVFWTAVGKYSNIVVSIVISMVLARLIAPEEFGIVAIAQVAISFISVISDMGIGSAIVQNKSLNDDDYDSIFTFTIFVAIFLSALICLLSPFLADFYQNTKIIPISIMTAISMFFGILSTVPGSMFNRDKRFKYLAKRGLIFNFIGGLISIIYAFMGGGCYALVLSPIITSICLLIINLKEYPRHIDWHFNISPIKKIFSFSFFQLLFNIINYFSRNLDKLIIGKALNMKKLGYYQKSYNLMLMPLQNITFVITPVLQPFLSDFQDDLKFIHDKYLEIIKLLATISVPMGVFLYFTGYEIIYIFYGAKWLPAVPAFEILAWSIPLQMVLSTTGSIFMATNNTKMLFLSGLVNSCITVGGFVICAIVHGSTEDFALSWTITNALNFINSFFVMFRFVFKSTDIVVYKEFFHPILNGIIMFCLCSIVQFFLREDNVIISLLLKLLIGILTTTISITLFKDYDLKSYAKGLKLKFYNK